MDQPLLVFVTVAEQKNFTRAAEQLHMTQPAVSQYIKTLERMVGTKLLERSNKYVRLNKAGIIVYHHAKEILGQYARMQCLVDDLMHTASGLLSLGASYTFGEYVLPHVIAGLHAQYPLIKPRITIGNTKEIAELVLNHQLDVGIVEGGLQRENLYVEPFAEDVMYVVAAADHPLAQQEQVSAAELTEATWIVREVGSGTREATEKMFAALQLTPADLLEFGSTQIIKESVEAGIGITLLSYWAIRKELSRGGLRRLAVRGIPVVRSFSLVTPATRFYTKATQIFLERVRQEGTLPALPD
ncbi:transcription regulator hth lysr [Lucifera butyrica]|uniref:Transcription regulator hth lysr n=1 Tax=Lucifera butyrica TaxID=1351585 RepID=A0A498RCY4_9FIRM|nr:LysR family transcriptional regulator [Lucifera butyrica]VBB09149.1 transcription regulator hth lysr [Lucifera butyrica]